MAVVSVPARVLWWVLGLLRGEVASAALEMVLPPLIGVEDAGTGAYMGGALEGSRLPSASAAGSGMCGQSSVSIQFKPDGGHDWEVYISHLLINTYAPSVESEGLVAEEIHGKHIVNRHPVNQCSPIPGIMTNQIDRVCH